MLPRIIYNQDHFAHFQLCGRVRDVYLTFKNNTNLFSSLLRLLLAEDMSQALQDIINKEGNSRWKSISSLGRRNRFYRWTGVGGNGSRRYQKRVGVLEG